MATSDDEWEYEYDADEKEIFLVDLDLSSLNQPLRSNVPGKRPLDRPPEPSTFYSSNTQHPTATNLSSPAPLNPTDDPFTQQESVQILSLPTLNPIISHRNTIYSATWTDMVGTNMFFSLPNPSHPLPPPQTAHHHHHHHHNQQQNPSSAPEATTTTTTGTTTTTHHPLPNHHPNLIGTSRIRLQCHRAHTSPKTSSSPSSRITGSKAKSNSNNSNSNQSSGGGGAAATTATTATSSRTARDAKERQADFLERLAGLRAKRRRITTTDMESGSGGGVEESTRPEE